ncbi:MAG: putative bifunctional diguanylate cyclase/phosphodiesterase, partial [Gaiellaceae bacterium]
MIASRPLTRSRRAPSKLLRPLGASVREALRAPRRVWIFIGVIALASTAAWGIVLGGLHTPAFGRSPVLAWYWLALAFYLAEILVVHLQFRKQAHTLSLTEIGLTLGLLLGAPTALLFGQLAGALIALGINRRRSQLRQLAKLAFNLSELPLCSAIALLVFRALASPTDSAPHLWVLVLLACAVAHIIGVMLVSLVIAVAEERLQAPQLGRTLVTSTLGALATASLGLAIVELLEVRPLAVVLLVIPVLACIAAFRGYMEQREQREHVEFLYESMRATQGAPEFGLAIGQLLVAARRLLRAEYAEILLLPAADGEGPLRSVSGAEGELLMHPEESFSSADAVAFREIGSIGSATLLARRRATHAFDAFLRARGLEDAIVAPLRGEDRTFGLLVVGERLGDVSTFAEADVELLVTFAGHASILLENGRLEHSLAEVTELKEQLRHQAYHDALTGLPNRSNLIEAVDHEIASGAGSAAVLYLDLDRFKTVNDTWGHSAGDELLAEFSRRLGGAIRPQDLAARIGGDEFAVLVRDVDAAGAGAVARRMLDTIDGTYALSCGDVACHVSVGIAVGAAGVTSGEDIIRNADIAMYSVKSSERSYTLYEAALHEELRVQRQLGLDLEAAIERREILVHFQPVVRLADGEIEGFEVLARWPHPTRGLLSAADFLPAAEETGLTIELGRLVLQQALEAARRWPERLSIWLNLAAAELANERLVDTLAEALKGYGVDPSRLVIEVTESGVIQGSDGALVAMRRLRELGVGLSIDDFGTGYSSLSRLAEFPIESLKIPKPFVDKLIGEDVDEAFVDAILRLGDSLGLATVAEGIEHPAQADRLRQLGCRFGQGYL